MIVFFNGPLITCCSGRVLRHQASLGVIHEIAQDTFTHSQTTRNLSNTDIQAGLKFSYVLSHRWSVQCTVSNMSCTVPMFSILLMPPLLHFLQPAPTRIPLISTILPLTPRGTQSFHCGTGSQSIQSIEVTSIVSCTRSVRV